jgi:hypothetical protein
VTYIDPGGYKFSQTWSVGHWVPGTDQAALDAAWRAVGGKGAMPLVSGKYSDPHGYVTQPFDQYTSIYVFGRYSVQNLTEGYSHDVVPKEKFYGAVEPFDETGEFSHPSTGRSVNPFVMCVDYESSSKCAISGGINPAMRSNSWGPVAFVAMYVQALSPNFPQGDPNVLALKLRGSTGGSFHSGWSCNGVAQTNYNDEACFATFDLQ